MCFVSPITARDNTRDHKRKGVSGCSNPQTWSGLYIKATLVKNIAPRLSPYALFLLSVVCTEVTATAGVRAKQNLANHAPKKGKANGDLQRKPCRFLFSPSCSISFFFGFSIRNSNMCHSVSPMTVISISIQYYLLFLNKFDIIETF